MHAYLLAIDQGTTNSRAIIFNHQGKLVSHHEMSLKYDSPHPGWVEQNPEEMFYHSLICCREALTKAHLTAQDIVAIGITNQRETTIIWDRKTSKPIYPAIVWQDRRTSKICNILQQSGMKIEVQQKTGLLLDPYFSATKIAWILQHVPNAMVRARNGELAFGTVESFLLWHFTQTKSHLTDITNASRTLLFNIHTQSWDQSLLNLFDIPADILPIVMDNTALFGMMDASFLGGAIPITAMAGDQQAAAIGQACCQPGMMKATYGTGCFVLLNTGDVSVKSQHQLVSTVAYRINKKITYGLEGSIFSAGSTIKWLRDELKIIKSAEETESLAKSVNDTLGVYLVPAFVGLGAPYWHPQAKAALLGLTYNSNIAHIARAALESVVYQTKDLLQAIIKDYADINTIRVDGGMTANNWLCQFLADLLQLKIEKPRYVETTALGIAYLAGLQVGLYDSLQHVSQWWQIEKCFKPQIAKKQMNDLYATWQTMVRRVL